MAAKLLHSLSDDNPELQKQIGCMTGIFQMFDRHNMIVSGRRISDRSRSHRMSLQRHSQYSNGSLEEDLMGSYQRQPAEMSSNNNASERQRFFTESSRASFSSSRSSSFSSVDYCRSHQLDPAYKDQVTLPEASSEYSRCSISPNFRDAVKDSMSRGLSNKPAFREVNTKSDNGYKSKEASRISYDWMETSQFSFESRETLAASKFRDLPRLSLDSKQSLMRQRDFDSLSSSKLSASLKRSCSTNENSQNMSQVSGTEQQRPPSLVAKLMGLTALPDATSASAIDKSLIKLDEFDAFRSSYLKKQILDSNPPSSKKEPASPRRVTSEMKPISSSMIHVEPAPWKKVNGDVCSLKQASSRIRSPTRHSNPFPSVYSEIEKRLKDIEFNQSGKDLRALKQILESIHAKGLLENEKHEPALNAATGRKNVSALIKTNLKKSTPDQDNARGKPRLDNATMRLESPIVIMKPISRPPRSELNLNINNSQTVSYNEKLKYVQHSNRPQQQTKDNKASSPRNLGSVSPRSSLKKAELEKQISSPSHSSDVNKIRIQVSKQLSESNSPGVKLRPKSGSQIHEILLGIKKLRSQENEAPLSADKYTPHGATRSVHSSKLNGSRSTSKKASKLAVLGSDYLSDTPIPPVRLDEVSPEYPSPVSVLKTSTYTDGLTMKENHASNSPGDIATKSPSADKSTLSSEHAFSLEISRKKLVSIDSLVQKLKRLNSTHDESKKDYIALLSDNTSPDNRYISEILLASGLLLREFGSNAQNIIQLHPSGNLINPELFNVLEQTKCYDLRLNEDATVVAKFHRKLIFDTLNEILTKKLASNWNIAAYSVVKQQKLAQKTINAQNLIKELCTDMQQLQSRKKAECEKENYNVTDMLRQDVMQQRSESVMIECGVSEVVLDVERLIFKEMVDEIVMSDGVGYRSRRKTRSGGSISFLKHK